LLLAVGFLTIFGLVMVFSASYVYATEVKKLPYYYYFLRQLAFAVAGFLALLGLMRLDYRKLRSPKVLIPALVAVALLLVAVFFQDGKEGEVKNTHRWLSLGLFSIQPSEFAKLAVVLFLSWFFHDTGDDVRKPEQMLVPCAVVGTLAGLVYAGKDLGQALMICLVGGVLMFLAGLDWRWLAGLSVALAVPVFYFGVYLSPYRLARISTFLHPERDPQGEGYQITQSLIAVGSGGVSGLGPGNSRQKFLFLPEAHNDFIFSVIGEEWGLIGTVLVVGAFLLLFYRGMKIALNSHDRFGFYLASGITAMIVAQGFVNISMALSMLPTKGIALPFLSYGGSSLLTNLAAAGILLNLSYQNKKDEIAA